MTNLTDKVKDAIEQGDSYHDYKYYDGYARDAIEAVYDHIMLAQPDTVGDVLRILKAGFEDK